MSWTAERKPHLSGGLESGGPKGLFPQSSQPWPASNVDNYFPPSYIRPAAYTGRRILLFCPRTLQLRSVTIQQLPRPIPEEADEIEWVI